MISRGGGPISERLGDRYRRDLLPSRSDEVGGGRASKRGDNPPSRHLWVGNLSHNISESDLTDCFLRLGEIDSVAFQPGRSYAFVNFQSEDDAIVAMKSLQGCPLAGNPLRIEFAKADKSSMPSRYDDYMQRQEEQRSSIRGSTSVERDSRLRSASPDSFYHEKSKASDRSLSPSEVLWIGYPALLKVDETILRKAFSPFGEIEKITVFQGRNYAFVRFRNISSACRAKETLQGKLFGNPKVHICFSRSEANSSGRASYSSNFKSKSHSGDDDSFRHDRDSGSFIAERSIESRFLSDIEPLDAEVCGFNRKGNLYAGDSNKTDNWRSVEELGPLRDAYGRRGSPIRGRGDHFDEYTRKFSLKDQIYEEPWGLSEESSPFHGAKRLKTANFPLETELPDYPYSDIEQERRVFSRGFSDLPQPDTSSRNFEHKMIPDRPLDLPHPHGGRSDHWKTSYDNIPAGSASLLSNPAPSDRKRFTSVPERPSLNLWKWEGTIAKGGTPVCQARCFPVQKAFDTNLPEVLDCTARTGLDMLAKHYYQAAGTWVVFFVPASDADMGYYNEFMHYLEEKQRAAVAKLDEKTTLFLVPPSDFSEKVLKVPGKLSISGVILRLEQQPAPNAALRYLLSERNDTNFLPVHEDVQYPKTANAVAAFSNMGKSITERLGNMGSSVPLTDFPGLAHDIGSMPESYNENRHGYVPQNWNSNLGSGNRKLMSQPSNTSSDPIEHLPVMSMRRQESNAGHLAGGMLSNSFQEKFPVQDMKPAFRHSSPMTGLQQQQVAELASSLVLQRRQLGSNINMSAGDDFRQTIAGGQYRPSQAYDLRNDHASAETPTNQFSQLQQFQPQPQMSNMSNTLPPSLQRDPQASVQGNLHMQGTSTQEETDADPQKRLQATLQLAATLLQQIQQGKGT